MKPSTVASKTMAIKARVYNQIRKDLFKAPQSVKTGIPNNYLSCDFSEDKKCALFDEWFELNRQAHNELNAYKRKRKEAKAIHEQRAKGDYYEKKYQKALRHMKRKEEEIEKLAPKVDFVSGDVNLNTYNNYVNGLNDIKA